MPRLHDPGRARRHWYYTRQQLCGLFDVGDSTITNWKRRGLKTIDERRPDVFHGFDVRCFHSENRWGSWREPKDGKLFCPQCHRYVSLLHETIKLRHNDLQYDQMSGHCIQCDTALQAYVRPSEIDHVHLAAQNNAGDSSANAGGPVPGQSGKRRDSVPPETNNINKRWLFQYQQFLVEHDGYGSAMADEHLRSLARASAIQNHKTFALYSQHDAIAVKESVRCLFKAQPPQLSLPTVDRALNHCKVFFQWLARQERVRLPSDLGGYFQLNKRERRLASLAVKGTELDFGQALTIFRQMPASDGIELRNRAIVALLLMTGIRVRALATLRGKHVDVGSWWINQLPPEVETKHDKHIRSYCLDLGYRLRDALAEWARWRDKNGFGDQDAFFLPDRFIGPNGIGLDYRSADADQPAAPWRSTDGVRTIIRSAAAAAGFPDLAIGAHDFRKVAHPYLSTKADMTERHRLALQLNLGQEPRETIHKHYSHMPDVEQAAALDELCRMVSGRSDTNLVLAVERGLIAEDDPDYERARQAHAKASAAIPDMRF